MENANQAAAWQSTAAHRETIKGHMPGVYSEILKKAEEVGNIAFQWVRRGLSGEANCFYAFENGYVVGTPFTVPGIHAEVAKRMVQFGCRYVCMWCADTAKDSNGTH